MFPRKVGKSTPGATRTDETEGLTEREGWADADPVGTAGTRNRRASATDRRIVRRASELRTVAGCDGTPNDLGSDGTFAGPRPRVKRAGGPFFPCTGPGA